MTPSRSRSLSAGSLALTMLAIAQPVIGHSWVESAYRIAPNGTMVGQPGFQRNYTGRADPGFSDIVDQLRIPPNPRGTVDATDPICKDAIGSYKAAYPMLQASPGDFVALQYLENGHVSLPQNQPNKPLNRGTVFIYGTADPRDTDTMLGIHLQWNANGTGGDGRGKLIATRNFDDGQCYEANSGAISQQRQKEFPKPAENPMGSNLYCQADLQLPVDIPTNGSTYTLYWVWDWPYLNPANMDINSTADGNYPSSILAGSDDRVVTAEMYTSCLEINVIQPCGTGSDDCLLNLAENVLSDVGVPAIPNDIAASFEHSQDLNHAAVQDQLTGDNFGVAEPQDDSQGQPDSTSNPDATPGSDPQQGVETITVTGAAQTVYQTVTVAPAPSPVADIAAGNIVIVTVTDTVIVEEPFPTAVAEATEPSVIGEVVDAVPTDISLDVPIVTGFLGGRAVGVRRRARGAWGFGGH